MLERMLEDCSGLAGVIASAAAYPECYEEDMHYATRFLAEHLHAAVVLWRVTADASPQMTIDCRCKEARIRQWDGRMLASVQTMARAYGVNLLGYDFYCQTLHLPVVQ